MRLKRERDADVAKAIRRTPPQRSREWTRSTTAQLSRLFLPPPSARRPKSSQSPLAAKEVRCLWSPKGMDARALQYKCYCAFSNERLCHYSERARCSANQPLGKIVRRSGKTKVWRFSLISLGQQELPHLSLCLKDNRSRVAIFAAAARLHPSGPWRPHDAYPEASTARGTH